MRKVAEPRCQLVPAAELFAACRAAFGVTPGEPVEPAWCYADHPGGHVRRTLAWVKFPRYPNREPVYLVAGDGVLDADPVPALRALQDALGGDAAGPHRLTEVRDPHLRTPPSSPEWWWEEVPVYELVFVAIA